MVSTIPEQITLILNKDIANLMAHFLECHMYEFRRLYDQHRHLVNPLVPGLPTLESRIAWIELMKTLKGEQEKQHAV